MVEVVMIGRGLPVRGAGDTRRNDDRYQRQRPQRLDPVGSKYEYASTVGNRAAVGAATAMDGSRA